MKITQIGVIGNDEKGMFIKLEQAYIPGLLEIEGFNFLTIIWWGHLYAEEKYRSQMLIPKPYRKGPDSIGVFATRSPVRPNPICISNIPVKEIDRTNGKIYTYYIDAEVDTPVLDIKPYYPCSDKILSAKTPNWNAHWPDSFEAAAGFDWEKEFNF